MVATNSTNSSTQRLDDFIISVIQRGQELAGRKEPLRVLESLIVVIVIVVSVIGNLFVMAAIIHRHRLRTATNYIIIGLSVSDICMALFVMLLTLCVLIEGKWPFGQKLCEAQGFFLFFFGYISIFLMVLTALNRYTCINRPSLYRKLFRKRKTILVVVSVYLVCGVGFSILPSLQLSKSYFLPGYAMCVMVITNPSMKLAHILFDSIVIPLCFITIAVCYFKVFRTIRQHNLTIADCNSTDNPTPDNEIHSDEIKVTKTLSLIVLGFTLTWLPTLIITSIGRSKPLVLPRQIQLLDTYLIFLSSSINPIIYCGMNAAFRAEYKALVMMCLPRRTAATCQDTNEMQVVK